MGIISFLQKPCKGVPLLVCTVPSHFIGSFAHNLENKGLLCFYSMPGAWSSLTVFLTDTKEIMEYLLYRK